MKLKDIQELIKEIAKSLELSEETIVKLVNGRFLSLYIGEWKTKRSGAKAWQLKAYERVEKGRRQLTLKTKTKNDPIAYERMKDLVELYTAYVHILKAKEILRRYKEKEGELQPTHTAKLPSPGTAEKLKDRTATDTHNEGET